MRRALVLTLLLTAGPGACGESRQELYMQGMKHEGDAERGPCKLLYDKQAGASLLSGDQVQQCLQMQSEAMALYDRAAALGLKDADFVQTHTQARARIERLEGMLKTIRSLERPDLDPPAPAARPADAKPEEVSAEAKSDDTVKK